MQSPRSYYNCGAFLEKDDISVVKQPFIMSYIFKNSR